MIYHPNPITEYAKEETLALRERHKSFIKDIVNLLSTDKEINAKLQGFGLKSIYLFGSVTRDQDVSLPLVDGSVDSDVDLYLQLDQIDPPKDFYERSVEVKEYIETQLADLVSKYNVELHVSHYPSDHRNLFDQNTQLLWQNI